MLILNSVPELQYMLNILVTSLDIFTYKYNLILTIVLAIYNTVYYNLQLFY